MKNFHGTFPSHKMIFIVEKHSWISIEKNALSKAITLFIGNYSSINCTEATLPYTPLWSRVKNSSTAFLISDSVRSSRDTTLKFSCRSRLVRSYTSTMGAFSCGWFRYVRLPIRRATLSVAKGRKHSVWKIRFLVCIQVTLNHSNYLVYSP